MWQPDTVAKGFIVAFNLAVVGFFIWAISTQPAARKFFRRFEPSWLRKRRQERTLRRQERAMAEIESLQAESRLPRDQQIEKRLDWLERKMVYVLHTLITIVGLGFGLVVGFGVADFLFGTYRGWLPLAVAFAVAIVTWLLLASSGKRRELEDAPGRVRMMWPRR
jgi:hypothetical protein